MKIQTLIRPKLRGAESLRGYIARVADRNSLSPLLKTMLYSVTAPTAAIHEVCQLTGCNPVAIAARGVVACADNFRYSGVRFGSALLPLSQVRLQRRMVCPTCIGEDGVSSCCWELRLYDVCHRHGCYLVDTCSACQQPLLWQYTSSETCPCGFRLAYIDVKLAPLSRKVFCTLLADAMAKSISVHDQSQHSDPERFPTIDWMLLLISVIDHVILPHFWRKYLTSPLMLSAPVRDELIATMLRDKLYRDHLRDTVFLQATKEPMTMAHALRPGNTPQELWKFFSPCLDEFALHSSLWKLNRGVHKPCDPPSLESLTDLEAYLSELDIRPRRKVRPRPRLPPAVHWRRVKRRLRATRFAATYAAIVKKL